MARIMCAKKLWRRLGQRESPASLARQTMPGILLGPWAAKVCRDAGREFVLALEQRTYLTLLMPGAPFSQFRRHFACALANALMDFGIPRGIVSIECAAIDFEPLVHLADNVLVERLDHIWYIAEIEFSYHEDLRIVQRNLNEIPHPNCDPCVPVQGVRRLFERAAMHRGFALQ